MVLSRDELVKLALEMERARQVMEALGARNCNGLSMEDRVALDVDYEIAKRRYQRAFDEYHQSLKDSI